MSFAAEQSWSEAGTATSEKGLASAIEAAAREVFEVGLGLSLYPLQNAEPPLVADMTVMVGLSGSLRGVLSMHYSVASACQWASKMTGKEMREFDQNVRDGVGEICNMVAGCFKRKLPPGMDDNCLISTPTVVSGTDYNLHSLSGGEHVEVSLGCQGAPLWITVDLRP